MSSLTSDTLINPQDLFDLSVTSASIASGATLGSLATTGDGRYFRYSIAGTVALIPGTLLQAIPEVAANEALSVTATAIGATSITTTTTVTVTANQYAGGWVAVTQTPGQGYLYQIGSHAAATAAVVTLNLLDPIQVALTTATQIDLVANTFNGVVISPTVASANTAGVAISALPIGAYGWIQTRGVANVLAQGTIVVGTQVAKSSTTAGAVVATSGVLASVGRAVTGISNTDYGAIDLNIS